MRRFQFRLAAVLRHRRALLDESRRAFGRTQAEVVAIQEDIRRMRRSREEHQAAIRAGSRGTLARTDQIRLHTYVNTLWLKMVLAGRRLAEAMNRAEEARRNMVKAHQNVRALEILEDKALKAWQAEADREERVFLDDLRSPAGLLASPVRAGGEA